MKKDIYGRKGEFLIIEVYLGCKQTEKKSFFLTP